MTLVVRGVVAAALLSGWPLLAQTPDSTTPRATSADSVPAVKRNIAARSMTEYLLARFPGVLAYSSSGTTGAGVRVRIRGSSSLLTTNEPVVYVDGVRIDGTESALTIDVGGQGPSRLDDVNPDDVDSIEVVRGPAAGVQYGAEAAHGVLLIHTTGRQAGPARFRVYAGEGRLSEPTRWPANYGGVDLDNASPSYQNGACTLQAEAAGLCTQDVIRTFAPLEARSQFATGSRREYGVRVSGAAPGVRYTMGVERETEGGTYRLSNAEADRLVAQYGDIRAHTWQPNTLGRTSFTGAVAFRPAARAEIGVTVLVLSRDLRLPFNDQHIYGLMFNGLRGSSDSMVNDGWAPFRPGELFQVLSSHAVGRRVASVRATFQPLEVLTVNAVAGFDDLDHEDYQLQRYGEGPSSGSGGSVSDNRVDATFRTLGMVATAAYGRAPALRASTRLGVRHVRRVRDELLQTGYNLPFGATSVSAAASWFLSESHRVDGRLSLFVEQELAWRSGVTLVGGLRRDDYSGPLSGIIWSPGLQPAGLDDEVPDTWHPALALAWSPGKPVGGPFGRLDLRASYGSASVWSGTTGVKPERTREVELAAGLALANGRGGAHVAAYDRRSTDVVELRYTSASGGFVQLLPANGAGITNRGIELELATRLIASPALGWDLALVAWGNRNRVTGAEVAAPSIATGQQHRPGYPIGGYWRRPITGFVDANQDGIIEPAEVVLGDTTVWSGTPFPSHGATLDTRLRLGHVIELGGLLEYRAGQHLFNRTAERRCAWGTCRALYDRATPLEQQAAAVAAFVSSSSGVEDADFLKLRELAVTLIAPAAWASRVRARSLRFTIAGRNLATWTRYSGADPEVNAYGQAGPGLATAELFTQPPVRFWTARLEVEF